MNLFFCHNEILRVFFQICLYAPLNFTPNNPNFHCWLISSRSNLMLYIVSISFFHGYQCNTMHNCCLLINWQCLNQLRLLCPLWFGFFQNCNPQMHCTSNPIQSNEESFIHCIYQSFSLSKNHFTEFNYNLVIDEHPVLIVDSNSLQYNVTFGVDFLDKWVFHLDYNHNLVQWMEFNAIFCDTSKIFSYNYYTSSFTPLDLEQKNDYLVEDYIKLYATCILDAKYEKENIHGVAFEQYHLLLDQQYEFFSVL